MGPLFAAASVSGKVPGYGRRRQLSRQANYGGWAASAEAYAKPATSGSAFRSATTGALLNYRISACEKAGSTKFPKDTAGFLELCKGLKEQHSGRHGARARLG